MKLKNDEVTFDSGQWNQEKKVTVLYSDEFFGARNAYAFWQEDCMDPPVYIVGADGIEEAHELLLEAMPMSMALSIIDPEDDDYKEALAKLEAGECVGGLTHTDYGWMDTETLNGREVDPEVITLDNTSQAVFFLVDMDFESDGGEYYISADDAVLVTLNTNEDGHEVATICNEDGYPIAEVGNAKDLRAVLSRRDIYTDDDEWFGWLTTYAKVAGYEVKAF